MEMEEGEGGGLPSEDLLDGEDQLMLFSGAHPRRYPDGIKSSRRRLSWPNGGCSEL
jgi:phage terminase large subunit-like protein